MGWTRPHHYPGLWSMEMSATEVAVRQMALIEEDEEWFIV